MCKGTKESRNFHVILLFLYKKRDCCPFVGNNLFFLIVIYDVILYIIVSYWQNYTNYCLT